MKEYEQSFIHCLLIFRHDSEILKISNQSNTRSFNTSKEGCASCGRREQIHPAYPRFNYIESLQFIITNFEVFPLSLTWTFPFIDFSRSVLVFKAQWIDSRSRIICFCFSWCAAWNLNNMWVRSSLTKFTTKKIIL